MTIEMDFGGFVILMLLIWGFFELFYFFDLDKFFNKNSTKNTCKWGCKCDKDEENKH